MLKFRPHHFLCTLGFQGKGYSPQFVENYSEIQQTLFQSGGDETLIEVVRDTDSICEPCPNRRDTLCTQQAKIERLDQGHTAIHGFQAGEVVTWGEAKNRMTQTFTVEKFNSACAPCGWKETGICEMALKKFLKLGMFLFFLFSAETTLAAVEAKLIKQAELKPVDELISTLVKRRSPLDLKEDLFVDYQLALQASSQLKQAQAALGKKEIDRAVQLAKEALRNFSAIEGAAPESPLGEIIRDRMAQANWILGDAYFRKKNWKPSLANYENAMTRLSGSRLLALLPAASIERYANACKIQKTILCDAWMHRLARLYPKDSVELKSILKVFPDLVDLPKPLPVEGGSATYRDPDKDIVAIQSAMQKYLQGDYGDAIGEFSEFLRKYPRSSQRVRAIFWLGKSFQKKGDDELAQESFNYALELSPLSYYGILASFETKKAIEDYLQADYPFAQSVDRFQTGPETHRLHRTERFLRARKPELAAYELREFRANQLSSEYLIYVMALNDRVGNFFTAFRYAGELLQRRADGIFSSYLLRIIFPVPYRDLIQKHSTHTGLDPFVILSLIKQESSFRSDAISSSGAMGLMQVMPFTAVEVDPKIEQAQIIHPDTGIRLGSKYLSNVLTRMNQNMILTLAGYNAGPNRAKEWKAAAKPEWSPIEFIESIPFSETRGYVAGILRNYYWYLALTTGEKLTSFDSFWSGGNFGASSRELPIESAYLRQAPKPQI